MSFVLWQGTLWAVIVYFMTGLSVKDGSWHFWVFYVIMCLTAINGSSLVRFMAYYAPDRDTANALIGIYSFTLYILYCEKMDEYSLRFFTCIFLAHDYADQNLTYFSSSGISNQLD